MMDIVWWFEQGHLPVVHNLPGTLSIYLVAANILGSMDWS